MRRASNEVVDELLVLRCREGDRRALTALVERWQERLWRHARRMTGHDDLAYDAVQDTWMAAGRGIVSLADAGAFRTWIFTILARAATSRLRERRLGGHDLPEAEAVPSATPVRSPRERALAEALDELDDDARVLLSLHHVEGFGVRDLSTILGVPTGTVKSRLHDARLALKQALERIERRHEEETR